jgi:hypothetical protein
MTLLSRSAMEMEIPKSFIDVSDIRQVPNNQECFVDTNSNSSLIIKILKLQTDFEIE